jgi:hypothetical protein
LGEPSSYSQHGRSSVRHPSGVYEGARALLLAAALCISCTYSTSARLAPPPPKVAPENVRILAFPGPRPFQVIGLVSAQSDGEEAQDVVDELRAVAGELGADAVWLQGCDFTTGGWSAGLRAWGIAVKYR